MIPVLTPDQSRAWDAAAESAGRPLRMLMETAGRAVASEVISHHGDAARRGVLILAGPGNNGGDGWVAARTLHLLGWPVQVVEAGPPTAGIAADARQVALDDGVATIAPDGQWPSVGVVVDALLGTGARGHPRGAIAIVLDRARTLGAVVVVSVDGPTGVDLETGENHGCLPADVTVTFGGLRRGHLLARDVVGELVVTEIGLPPADPDWPALVDRAWVTDRLGAFDPYTHKGHRGRVVIVGGTEGMGGAARLAARGAFAAGAGLVHVVTTPGSAESLRTAEPDVQVIADALDGGLDDEAAAIVARADAVVVGPGLGRDASRRGVVLAVLQHKRRTLLDADALMLLAAEPASVATALRSTACLVTPHRGEFAALFPTLAGQAESDPWGAATAAAESAGCAILLKGVPTVVVAPSRRVLTVAAGNPGLATGGSGDVLAGMAAALRPQGLEWYDAAAVAAQAHGEAADRAADRLGVRGMRPMDVVAALAETWTAWRDQPGGAATDLCRMAPPRCA